MGAIRWAAPVLLRVRKDGLQAYTQICSTARKTAAPIRLQSLSGHLVKHLAKPQANKWWPAKEEKEYSRIQQNFENI